MHYYGVGSRESPIAIEDSEEEVLQELRADNSSSTSTSPSSRAEFQRPTLEQRLADGTSGVPMYENFGVDYIPGTGKRKRAESDVGMAPMASTIPYPHPHPVHAPLLSQPQPLLSKKARKRQRRAERQAMMEGRNFPPLQHPIQYPHAHGLPPALPSMPPYQWHDPATPMLDYSEPASTSASAWVSSMAHAGGVPVQFAEPAHGYSLGAPEWPPPQYPPHPPPPPPSVNVPSRPRPPPVIIPAQPMTQPPPVPSPSVSNPPPNPIQSSTGPMPRIGMEPEPDSASIHGLFDLPVANGVKPYQPNPARTLVMEQLPKQSRNRDFLHIWTKRICDAHPTCVVIDAPRAKALLEFSTAEQARKCWASPKLGQELIGLPTHLLKGKPRVDLIKVWWYRLPGVGANSGVGEIEEGEIEGDEEGEIVEIQEVQEVQPQPSKESKKERKARLARERADKERLRASLVTESGLPASTAQPAQVFTASPTSATNTYTNQNGRNMHPLPLRPQAKSVQQPGSVSASAAVQPMLPTPSHQPAAPRLSTHNFYQPVAPPLTDEETLDSEDMELDSPVTPNQPSNEVFPSSSTTVPSGSQQPLYAPPDNIAAPQPHPVPTTQRSTLSASTPAFYPAGSKSGSPIPSEPRAMKHPPTAPSFTKRALLAKQKELEQQIAKQKLQLGLSIPPTPITPVVESTSNSPLNTPPLSPPLPSTPNEPSRFNADNQAAEERLRSLVLKSRLSRMKTDKEGSASPSNHPSTPAPVQPTPQAPTNGQATTSSVKPSEKLNLTASTGADALSIDDLAVSFITETIQTVQPVKVPPPPPPVATDSKAQLVARQRQLEQHIAESKVLMEQLTNAKTKQEKDQILAIMRQRSRLLEEGNVSNGSNQLESPTTKYLEPFEKVSILNTHTSVKLMPTVTVKWPESRYDANILVISDDEDSDDE